MNTLNRRQQFRIAEMWVAGAAIHNEEKDMAKAFIDAWELLQKAHFFMNAQAYEQDDCDDFCRKLADFLGKPT